MLFRTSNFFYDVDIQLILELKKSFGKYHPVFPKNPYRVVILGHHVDFTFWIQINIGIKGHQVEYCKLKKYISKIFVNFSDII